MLWKEEEIELFLAVPPAKSAKERGTPVKQGFPVNTQRETSIRPRKEGG